MIVYGERNLLLTTHAIYTSDLEYDKHRRIVTFAIS